MYEDAQLILPLIIKDKEKAHTNNYDKSEYLKIPAEDNKFFIAALTNIVEDTEEKYPYIVFTSMKDFFEDFINDDFDADGIILNPEYEEKKLILTKSLIKSLLEMKTPENELIVFSSSVEYLEIEAVVISEEDDDFEQTTFENEDLLTSLHFMKKMQDDNQYIINTPLINYKGEDEDIIQLCYWLCLDLAKKYNLHRIAFQNELSFLDVPIFKSNRHLVCRK